MGADRSISVGSRLVISSYPKIFKRDNALIGMAGNSDTISLLEQYLSFPKRNIKKKDILHTVINVIIPSCRHMLADNDMDDQRDVDMIIAWMGEIIWINCLSTVTTISDDVFSIGVFDTAHVVLSVTSGSPKNRMLKTLKACAKEMPGAISEPFDVEFVADE